MPAEVTPSLNAIEQGDPKAAGELLPLVYEELRKLAAARMARELPGQTLQPTALVHEAWLRLAAAEESKCRNRAHFFAAPAEAMRRILIDRARKRQVRLASGLANPEVFEDSQIEVKVPAEELIALHEVLDRLAIVDSDAARLVKLRYFVGMNMSQAAEAMELTLRGAERLWTFGKA